MTLRIYQLLNLQGFYGTIQDKKMPMKVTYKLYRVAESVAKELEFYNKKRMEIIEEHRNPDVEPDATGKISIKQDEVAICNEKLNELINLEVEINLPMFSISDFVGLDITFSELSGILPLIKDED